ncbi:MAG: MFS transporter, partial [Pseudomonadota bacterium]|nr:MFS transporter [Pseudomonadota bacterium]
LAVMMLFQWYAMFCYWEYITVSLARTLYGSTDAATPGFGEAVLITGRIGGFYNFIAFAAAIAMMPLARRMGPQRLHAACLLTGGAGLLGLPLIHDPWLLFLPMLGLGLSWGSMMGNPYAMLAGSIPADRVGVYMGIFNGFIVLPMLLQIVTIPLLYHRVLGDDPENVIRLAGLGLLIAALLTLRVRSAATG